MMRTASRRAIAGVIVLAVLAATYVAVFQGDLDEIDAARVQRQRLLDDYLRLAGVAINLDLYRQQRRELDDTFGALLERLPIKGVHGDREREVRESIRDAASASGVGVPVVTVGPETAGDVLAHRRLDVMASGSFRGLVKFAQDVSTASMENWTVQYASLKPDASGRSLTLLLELRVHRPLSEDELEAGRKAVKEGKK